MTEAEFQARVTAIAWGIVADTLSDITTRKPIRASKTNPDVLMSRTDQYLKLLASKEGKWARRDSDNVYVCQGPADTADTYLMKKESDGRVITVSFVSIRSKWNHIP